VSPGLVEAPAQAALVMTQVRAGYDRVEVLHDVSLTVPTGSVVALLGPNGAGKSTTVRAASGEIVPMAGRIEVLGANARKLSIARRVQRGVCLVPEGRGVFSNLTVSEHLRMWTYKSGTSRREIEERTYAQFPRLGERRRQLAGTLSGGEQQMLAMSRALTTGPQLLLLDEISMGLAPIIVEELYAIIGQLATEGYSILLTEQFAEMALRIASSAIVIIRGSVAMTGSPDEVRAALQDLYLRG
jgi:branched-chain amino acid transport system ATP-binding protein